MSCHPSHSFIRIHIHPAADIFSCTLELQVSTTHTTGALGTKQLQSSLTAGTVWVALARCMTGSTPKASLLRRQTQHPALTSHSAHTLSSAAAGCLMGMALASFGSDAVIWYKSSSSFPYVK